MVTELWHIQECLEKINRRGITWKLRKGKQSFLCATHSDLIHIPIKFHVRLLSYGAYKNVYGQMDGQRHAIIHLFFSKQAYKNHPPV